jgi:hypothetical protein
MEAPGNYSSVFLILQSFGRRLRIVTFTLLIVFKNFSFICCNITESGPVGRADVPSYDAIPKVFFLQHFSILATFVLG